MVKVKGYDLCTESTVACSTCMTQASYLPDITHGILQPSKTVPTSPTEWIFLWRREWWRLEESYGVCCICKVRVKYSSLLAMFDIISQPMAESVRCGLFIPNEDAIW